MKRLLIAIALLPLFDEETRRVVAKTRRTLCGVTPAPVNSNHQLGDDGRAYFCIVTAERIETV